MVLATIIGNNALLPYGFVKSLLKCKDYEHIWGIGLYLADNRNNVWRETRGQDLLFIDSDMVFTLEDVKKIEEHLKDKDVVTGLYPMGVKGYPPAIFNRKDGIFDLALPQDKIFEVDACGAGFLGISKRVVLESPFTRFVNEATGNMLGEDMAFCVKVKEAGYKIFCDPTVRLGHIKTQII